MINNCTRYTNPTEILELQKLYYTQLYASSKDNSNESGFQIDTYLQKIEIPMLSEESKDLCDKHITIEEVKEAVDNLANNKSPGPDGIPIEFYKMFWPEIGNLVLQSFLSAFDNGELTDSQKQGIITLIPKKGKDLTDLKSWRPLSLLNADYKIIAKTLGNRLKTALPEIISPDQVGYMQNRFCGENIRLIADVIDYCKYYQQSCCIFLADFEKAFDTVKWTFLAKILKNYGFGDNFQKWVSILYKNAMSCVTNNGYVSSYFNLYKGIRQGCPISALLFLLIAEIIALVLKQSKQVSGIRVEDQDIKLCQLADDMTLFLLDINSVQHAITLFEEFYRYSGLKLNKGKTEAFIIKGTAQFNKDHTLGIKWIDGPFKTLGTWFSCDNSEFLHLNTKTKMNCIQNIIMSWQPRCLTLKGKITVVKSLVIPHLLQVASALPLSDSFVHDLEVLLLNFVWNNKKHLIAKNVLSLPYELGGLKMVSIRDMVSAAKIMWIKRLANNIQANWKVLALHLMGLTRDRLLKRQQFKTIQNDIKTKFYANLLSTWCDFTSYKVESVCDFLTEPIFNNPCITINDNVLVDRNSKWEKAGIIKVSDILAEDRKTFVPKLALENKHNISISDMLYNQLTSLFSSIMKSLPKTTTSPMHKYQQFPKKCLAEISKVTSSQLNTYYAVKAYRSPSSQAKWIQYYPFLEALKWENIYTLPFKVVSDTYIITLQYKIIHRVFACSEQLYLWKIVESPLCIYCNSNENIEHFFYYCPDTQHFWQEVGTWLTRNMSYKIELTVLEVLFGLPNVDPKYYFAVNFVILIGKYSINKSKKQEEYLNLEKFLKCLKWKLKIERSIYQNQGRLPIFEKRFRLLN